MSTFAAPGEPVDPEEKPKKRTKRDYKQWLVSDQVYRPVGDLVTIKKLPPGYYEIENDKGGIYFVDLEVRTESLIKFPDSTSQMVLKDIQSFWTREAVFRKYNLSYKRGIMLYGPPGSGKSCTLRMIAEDVIQRGGVIFNFGESPDMFYEGYMSFRTIQPETPIVVLMEDVDGILSSMAESKVLNILDGVKQIDKIVFLATTNYPSQLKARVMNRPSRFDKRFEVGYPSAESRELYFTSLFKDDDISQFPVAMSSIVADTKDMTFAHLRELFVSVHILGDTYENAIETLRSMKTQVLEDEDFKQKKGNLGFTRGRVDRDDSEDSDNKW
jgi:energy-coupling factor transporter ATP-binding protein EcfA2